MVREMAFSVSTQAWTKRNRHLLTITSRTSESREQLHASFAIEIIASYLL